MEEIKYIPEEIKDIIEDIWDELEGAKKYAMRALRYKPESKNLTDSYAAMAAEELHHVDVLHGQGVQLVKSKENALTKAVWDWEHEKMIEHTAKIKTLLDMVRK